MKWWVRRPKIEVATLAQMEQRIKQLEADHGTKVLYAHVGEYNAFDPNVQEHGKGLLARHIERLPESVRGLLDMSKGEEWGTAYRASGVGWRDVLTPKRVTAADGTAISGTSSETIMVPDFTFAADYMEVGDAFKYTLIGKYSTVITTPGTITKRLRWGGVAGTSLAASGAFAPDTTAAGTDLTYWDEWMLVVRSVGATGSMLAVGKLGWNDFDDTSAATIVGNLNMNFAPVSGAAAVSSLDTTTAKALSPTWQGSVTTSGMTNLIALLESLN